MRAPVFPALTQASAIPSLTRFRATRMEESFLLRNALDGASSIITVWLACRVFSLSTGTAEWRSSSAVMDASSPTRIICRSGYPVNACKAAGTTTAQPTSPPIASSAIVTGLFMPCSQTTQVRAPGPVASAPGEQQLPAQVHIIIRTAISPAFCRSPCGHDRIHRR